MRVSTERSALKMLNEGAGDRNNLSRSGMGNVSELRSETEGELDGPAVHQYSAGQMMI